MSPSDRYSTEQWRRVFAELLKQPESLFNNEYQDCPLCGSANDFKGQEMDPGYHMVCNNCGGLDGKGGMLTHFGFAERILKLDRVTTKDRVAAFLGLSQPKRPRATTQSQLKQLDFNEGQRFIEALGKPPGTVRLRAFLHKEHPDKASDLGRKGGMSRSLVTQWQAEGRGVYVVVNDGGDKDADITTCRAFFCEWDNRPVEWQLTAWQELGLPEPTMQVSTGGKSIHNYWVLSDAITTEHWKLIQTRLLNYADADRSTKNLARVMRLPGTYHAGADGSLGSMCKIVGFTGQRYTIFDLESALPDEIFYTHQAQAQREDYKPASIHEVKDALACIPQREAGSNTYEKYRNILWSLKAIVSEDQAISFMETHSPSGLCGWNVSQVARSGGDKIGPGTFWYWARFHGYSSPSTRQLPQPRTVQQPATEPDQVINLQLYSKSTTEWLDLVVQHVFQCPSQRWICVEGVLHYWNGTHYKPVADEELTPSIAAFLSRIHVVDHKTGEHQYPWKRPKYIDEALAWMRRLLTPVAVNPQSAINCRNGIVSWTWKDRTIEVLFQPHTPDLYFTYVTEYDYDPQANPQHLLRLLEAVEPGDRDTLQRILGSGLHLSKYRASCGRPRAVLMIGEGSNGKDTIRTALRDTLGSRNFTSCTLADFRQYDNGRKFPIAPLRGASVNWSSENSQFVHIDNLQSLKAAISGEELSYELKGVQESQFVPSALFVFNLNKDPSLSGDQIAVETRFHVFRFLKTFMASPSEPNHIQADPRLKDDPEFIQQMICPAFLNWLLEGLALSVADGIDYSTGKAAMEDVRRSSCHLWEFCDAVGLRYDPDGQVSVATVYDRLRSWYRDEGYLDKADRWVIDQPSDRTVKASRLMVGALKQIFPKLASERGSGKSRERLIKGLKLDTWQ
jgi:putative DNA primase/helicase